MSAPRQPIDSLCMIQACRGVLLDLDCDLEQWADHYDVPSEALRAMVADIFIFQRSGREPLSAEDFAEYANEIIAQESGVEIELTRIASPEVVVEPDRLLTQGYVSGFHERWNGMNQPKSVEVLAPPSMAEWISNCAAGRPSGETPRLIGPETLFDKIKFCRTNIANLEERLSEEITSGDYEEAEETCQELKAEVRWMVQILMHVHDSDAEMGSPGIPSAELVDPD
jgi:hypothetical protein